MRISFLVVFFLVGPLSAEDAEEMGHPLCEEVQTHRELRLREWTRLHPRECDRIGAFLPKVPSELWDKVKGSVQVPSPSPKNPRQAAFAECIGGVLNDVQERRESDNKLIEEEIKRWSMNRFPKTRQMKMIEDLLDSEDSFYSYFKHRFENTKGRTYRHTHKTFTGPALEMATALRGKVVDVDKTERVIFEKSGFEVLREQDNPIEFLLEKMKTREPQEVGPAPLSENFTPGMSKIILFEMIRSLYRESSEDAAIENFRDFAGKIRLGVTIPDREFGHDSRNRKRFQHTINDGYFLSSKRHNMHPEDESHPLSFDCTSLIQYCAFGADSFHKVPEEDDYDGSTYSRNKFNLVSRQFGMAYRSLQESNYDPGDNPANLHSISNINRTFDLQRLESESQLKEGDMIVFNGHMLIFSHYERGEDGKIKMKTIEATGNQFRTIGELSREIYDEDCSHFAWTRNDVLTPKKRDVFIVRFKEI